MLQIGIFLTFLVIFSSGYHGRLERKGDVPEPAEHVDVEEVGRLGRRQNVDRLGDHAQEYAIVSAWI
jgi:hypothetical protein